MREMDPCEKAETLQRFTGGPLSSSIAKLSGSSRGIPWEKDFHFYYNFPEFKVPIKEICDKSQLMLETIGSSWGKEMAYSKDYEEAYEWLVNVNDEVLERLDASFDEFQRLRNQEDESSQNGFQLVYGKKKKKTDMAVKVASRDRKTTPKVPFHIPTIPRPQDQYKILVNNSNQRFEHVWLQKSDDGSTFIHPLEKCSFLDFVDENVSDLEPVKPPPIECTPFTLVEEVKDLKELAAKLRGVDEFAVDLEHNQYRSFQGLTCLMQISTRTHDFVVDTLKLRIHIGPYLREVFKDPTKKKVMHGADRDIMWLQRDFGIYVCNLFDTGQASRVLKLERHSLEYLLHHFCDVTANKQYQNADWRLRPLPDEMLRYAREDTHYLLHINDLMRIRFLSPCSEFGTSEAPLIEVYKRSYDICLPLYEKEILTDSSYLYIYGLQGAGFNAQQLAIVAGLCEWRDVVARAEDESTGYILPNKILLEIAKQMPVTGSKLRRLVMSKHPYIERNLGSVVSIIRHSMQNATAFEAASEQLKKGRTENASYGNIVVADGSEALTPCYAFARLKPGAESVGVGGSNVKSDILFGCPPISLQIKENSLELLSSADEVVRNQCESSSGDDGNVKVSGAEATVQVLKKPSRAFGTLLGNSASKRKFDHGKKEKEELKLDQIKSSVNLPFHSFLGGVEELQPVVVKERAKASEASHHQEAVAVPATVSNIQEIILLEDDSDVEESANGDDSKPASPNHHGTTSGSNLEEIIVLEDDSNGDDYEGDGTTVSLCDLSSSFQKCLQSTHQSRKAQECEEGLLQLKPFDYEAARKQVRFGEDSKGTTEDRSRFNKGNTKKASLVVGQSQEAEGTGDFQQGRRRQAFPASGNRSTTFR